MNKSFISNLKTPCKNREIQLVDNHDGSINLDGNRFETIIETENYISSKERKDL